MWVGGGEQCLCLYVFKSGGRMHEAFTSVVSETIPTSTLLRSQP